MKKSILVILALLGLGMGLVKAKNDAFDRLKQYEEKHKLKPGEAIGSSLMKMLANPKITDEDKKLLIKHGLAGHMNIELEVHKRGTQLNEAYISLIKMQQLLTPKNVALLGGAAFLTFAAWHSTSLAARVVGHHVMLPPLADPSRTSIRSWTERVKRYFIPSKEETPKRTEAIFGAEVRDRVEHFAQSVISCAEYDLNFRHCLLMGPPGTGKTMISTALAKEANIEHMCFSAGALFKYSVEEGIKQIDHLFAYAKNYGKKMVVFIDEADALFVNREDVAGSDKAQQFLSHLLSILGTEQSSYVVIASTNRPHTFDSAVLSRFPIQIHIGLPGVSERKGLFVQYSTKYFIDSHKEKRDERGFFATIFTNAPKQRQALVIGQDALSVESINEYVALTEGFSGRDISYLLIGAQHRAYAPDANFTVTKDMILKEIQFMKFKKNQEENGFSLFKLAPKAKASTKAA